MDEELTPEEKRQLMMALIETAKATKLLAHSVLQNTQKISEALSRPKQVVRGPDGSIIGVQ